MRKKSNEERQAEEIEQQTLFCRQCGQFVDEHRVYFGMVGPFCNTECRDEYARMP